MTSILFGLFLALALIVCVLAVIRSRVDEKMRLPRFLWNEVGGTLAVCAYSNFEDAKGHGGAIGGKIVVRDTLVFSNHESKYQSGSIDQGFGSSLSPRKENDDLFVPFTSEGLMSFAEQEEFFTKPRDRKEFAEAKLLEALSEDWRLRFAFWWEKRRCDKFLIPAVISLFVVGAAFLLAVSSERDKAKGSKEIVVYTTHENGVHETTTTRSEVNRLLMYTDEEGSRLIGGRISKIQPISVGLAQACFLGSDKRMECGVTVATSKIGDEVFVRFGNVTFWSSVEGRNGYHGGFRWLITKAEAGALVATGKFKIID